MDLGLDKLRQSAETESLLSKTLLRLDGIAASRLSVRIDWAPEQCGMSELSQLDVRRRGIAQAGARDLSEPRPSGTTGGQPHQTARHRLSRSQVFQEIGQFHSPFKSFSFQDKIVKS